VVGCRTRLRCSDCHCPALHLDDAPGYDVLGTIVHDVELLAALIVAGFRVRVAVDDLDRPLGILELHLLLITLVGHLLIAFSLAGRHAVVAQLLLLLLAELLHELLDLSALLGTVAPGVVHRTLQMTLVTVGGLSQLLVTAWATAPTSRCRQWEHLSVTCYCCHQPSSSSSSYSYSCHCSEQWHLLRASQPSLPPE
jgi:hypothetical protein